jgi:hypothetical protein
MSIAVVYASTTENETLKTQVRHCGASDLASYFLARFRGSLA